MIRSILLCLLFYCFSFDGWANTQFNSSELQLLTNEVSIDIQKAELCLPVITPEHILFCTGVDMPLKVVKDISIGGLSACVKMIQDKGYRVIEEGSSEKVSPDLWNSFYRSTKWAETIHEEKYVFMKKIGTDIDCLHELVHVYQWTSKNSNPMSPIQRNSKYSRLESLLLKSTDFLTSIKNKNSSESAYISSLIENGMKVLKKYSAVSSWLDEKDVYAFLYSVCDKKIKCRADDWDTLVGNLFLLKDKLPWKFRNEINSKAYFSVRAKEESFIGKSSFIPLDEKDYAEANALFSKDWNELFAYMKAKNVHLLQFVLSQKSNKVSELDKIPNQLLIKLDEPKKENLVSLLNYSKLNQGYVLGKFICTSRAAENFIIVTSNSTKEVLIHEYLHYLQSLKNPQLCHALTEQNNSSIDFKTGKISRKEYESIILADKVIIWNTEREVYQFMSTHQSQSELENNNNKIQFLVYQTRLTKGNILLESPEFEGIRIDFSVDDDLPLVKIFERPFVLDLGAMDSVIAPQLVFKNYPIESITPVKMKTLGNSRGEMVEAPLTVFNTPFQLADGKKIKKFQWILANLQLPQADGVIGLNLFRNKEIVLYPKKKYIEITNFRKKPKEALDLQRDYDNEIRTLEFICPQKKLIARLDSGSQVLGDVRTSLSDSIKKQIHGPKGYLCGRLKISGDFKSDLQNDVLFSHDVGINLGWPWLSQFNKISISLKNAWISFE